MVSRESAIPDSRATVATTPTIARDCDQPIDQGRRPREEETHYEAGEKSTTEATRHNREPKTTEAKRRNLRGEQLTKSAEAAPHSECEERK